MKSAINPIQLLILLLLSALSAGAQERVFREFKSSDGLADNSVQSIRCTRTGRMAISTLGNINFYEGVKFSYINMDAEYVFPLSNYHGHTHLYFDSFHHLWLKREHGVQAIDLTMERPINNVDSVLQELGADGRVDDIFTDEQGEVWMMIDNKLFGCKCKKRFPIISGLNLQDIEVYNNHLLMFYNNGEMIEFDIKSEKIAYRGRAYDESLTERYSSSSVIFKKDDGFFQIRNGKKESILLWLDMSTHQWTTILQLDYHMNNMDVYDDVLYVASEYCYWTFNIKTHELDHIEKLKLRDGTVLTTDVNTVAFDKQGGMWLGTEQRGLLYSRKLAIPFKSYHWSDPLYDKYDKLIKQLTTNKVINEFNGKKANCLFIDSRNKTWIGTTKGLEYYVSSQSEPFLITTKNGLLNNVIHSIVEDNMRNIWVSTSYGIACVVMKGDQVRYTMSYNHTFDDIPNETFKNCMAAKLPDGCIVMETLDHIVHFNPEKFRMLRGNMPFKIYPKLIRLMVNGYIVETGVEYDGTLILDKAISRVDTINVNYDQNSLSLLFCGLNYIRPLQTYYRFRVHGISEEWTVLSYYNSDGKVDADGLLHLPLTSLQPGIYQIELQTSMNPDAWETTPTKWTIIVHEPWWRARGFLALLGLVLLVLMIINFVFYNRNTRLKMRRNNEEGELIRRVRNFVERCDGLEGEMMEPSLEEIFNDGTELRSELSDDFIEIMTDVVPYVHELKGGELSMHDMSQLTGVELQQLYEILSANLYKSPRSLARTLRLHKGAELLATTQHSIEQVAAECGFLSHNYFIAHFFHLYKQTPAEYRQQHSKGNTKK